MTTETVNTPIQEVQLRQETVKESILQSNLRINSLKEGIGEFNKQLSELPVSKAQVAEVDAAISRVYGVFSSSLPRADLKKILNCAVEGNPEARDLLSLYINEDRLGVKSGLLSASGVSRLDKCIEVMAQKRKEAGFSITEEAIEKLADARASFAAALSYCPLETYLRFRELNDQITSSWREQRAVEKELRNLESLLTPDVLEEELDYALEVLLADADRSKSMTVEAAISKTGGRIRAVRNFIHDAIGASKYAAAALGYSTMVVIVAVSAISGIAETPGALISPFVRAWGVPLFLSSVAFGTVASAVREFRSKGISYLDNDGQWKLLRK